MSKERLIQIMELVLELHKTNSNYNATMTVGRFDSWVMVYDMDKKPEDEMTIYDSEDTCVAWHIHDPQFDALEARLRDLIQQAGEVKRDDV